MKTPKEKKLPSENWTIRVKVDGQEYRITRETGARVAVNIGQIIKAERPFLDPEQIDAFLSAVKGKIIEIAALLALSSLRRSEILGLDWSNVDLENRIIHVRGAAVFDENWQLMQKAENKNVTSRGDVPMIEPLYAALSNAKPQEGKVLSGSIRRICTKE